MNAAINLGVEDMSATVVRYGLYLGAIFQIFCLLACAFMPDSPDDSWLNKVYVKLEITCMLFKILEI